MRGLILTAESERLVVEATKEEVALFTRGTEVTVARRDIDRDDFHAGVLYERERCDNERGRYSSRDPLASIVKESYGWRHMFSEHEHPRKAYCRLITACLCEDVQVVNWPPPRYIRRATSKPMKNYSVHLSSSVMHSVVEFEMFRQTGPITFEYREV